MRHILQRMAAVLTVVMMLALPIVVSAACPEGTRFEAPTGNCVPDTGSAAGSGAGASTILVNPIGGTTANPGGTSDVPHLLGNVLRALFGVLGSIALLMFIYGGFLWLTSGGAAEKIQKGKETMVWAILGIAVIFASFAIVSFVIDRLTVGA
ncbi:MAG: pilin [bacterium]|nr:pilin [bacterium]